MSKSRDEVVDGPRIAAQILNQMPEANRARLVEYMRERNPQLLGQVLKNIFSFEDIPTLSPQGIQRLIKESGHQDLVYAIYGADENVATALLVNMSQRKRDLINADLPLAANASDPELRQAKDRIVATLDKLRASGLALEK